MRTVPSGVNIILIGTVVAYLLQSVAGNSVIGSFALWPLQSGFKPWQLISYAFLHGSITHIAFNMYGLWLFGRQVEGLLGRRVFLQLYFSSVISAGLMQLLVTAYSGSVFPTIGASGGVFGVLLAYGLFFPNQVIILLIPPIPMPARVFVVLYAVLELILGVTGTEAGVAHFAHLGGMVGGYLVIHRWRRGGRSL